MLTLLKVYFAAKNLIQAAKNGKPTQDEFEALVKAVEGYSVVAQDARAEDICAKPQESSV